MKLLASFEHLRSYKNSFLTFILVLFLLQGPAYYMAGHFSRWGDEGHFVQTIQIFAARFDLNLLKHYNEMSAPLPFALYALWGKIFGLNVYALRWLSLLIAFATYLLFFHLNYRIFTDGRPALFASLLLIIQPYMIGFSLFVFTDMIPIFASILGLWAVFRKNPYWLAVSIMIGILSRQYFVFFILSCGVYYLLQAVFYRNRLSLKMLFALLIGMLPGALLFVLWHGLSPDNQVKSLYLNEAFRFHFDYVTLYIALFTIYLFPLLIWQAKRFYSNKKIRLFSLAGAGYYIAFPVKPCPASQAVGLKTVGYFHKLTRMAGIQHLDFVAFLIAFILALPFLIFIVKDTIYFIRVQRFDLRFLSGLSILSFLSVMPFSYLLWEKYFVPVIPFVILNVFLIAYSSKTLQYGRQF